MVLKRRKGLAGGLRMREAVLTLNLINLIYIKWLLVYYYPIVF